MALWTEAKNADEWGCSDFVIHQYGEQPDDCPKASQMRDLLEHAGYSVRTCLRKGWEGRDEVWQIADGEVNLPRAFSPIEGFNRMGKPRGRGLSALKKWIKRNPKSVHLGVIQCPHCLENIAITAERR